MNPMNELLCVATANALDALRFLDEAGATVISIEIRNARPVIVLDGEPPRFVRGALHKSTPTRIGSEHVMVAMVKGCRVEWTVRTVRGVVDCAAEG